jgi:glycosyltransferase involved in cell wall biosynthesis
MSRPLVVHVCTIDLSLRHLLFHQLQYLSDNGYDVVGVSAPGPDVSWLQAHGLRHEAVAMTRSFTPGQDLCALQDLTRLFRRLRPTIVHTHNPKPGLLGQLAARAAGVPIVVNTLHGFYFHDRMPKAQRRFYVAMEQVAAACSDFILSQNPEDVQTALKERICREDTIALLGNGIDLQAFRPGRFTAAERSALRASFGFGDEDEVVGFVGRLVREKGIEELCAAFARLHKEHPRARLLLIGPTDTDKADALAESGLRARFGLGPEVAFAGMRHDMPQLYDAMDLFVLPSWREGFPRSPMEAAATGKAVIVTDIRGGREVVQDQVTGWLVAVKDEAALWAALRDALADPTTRTRYGQAGWRLAQERFDERVVFARVAETYARLLIRHSRR